MRILLVEDHEDTRETLRRLFLEWGFEVSAAPTLQKALALFRAEAFDAIVADIGLPDGTGYALVSEARRQVKDVLAIAFSAYRYPKDVDEAKTTGFDHHLTKPLDLPLLRSLLEKKNTSG